MKVLLLCCLFYPLMLFSQVEPISIGVRDGPDYSMSYNSFAKRFREASYIVVQVSDTAFYHRRKIKKVELLGNQSSLFWSVEFDASGKVVQEGTKGEDFFISKQYITDTLNHTDTLILQYHRLSKLMRSDTIVTHQFQYKCADTVMSFSRQHITTWYNGELMNEQNHYYNEQFLNKRINTDQRNGISYDIAVGKRRNPKGHIYLHKKLKTSYDSSQMYSYIRETRDVNFSGLSDFGSKQLDVTNIKKHPFVKMLGSSNYRKCMTTSACFDEPVVFYETSSCGTGMYEAQLTRARTSYGYTYRSDGLFDTYYSEYYPGRELLYRGEGRPQITTAERTTLLRFKYTWF